MSGKNLFSPSLDELVEPVSDGCLLALPADYSGVAMAATWPLLRRGVRDLKLLCVPTGTLQADCLIGAGRVASIEAAAVSLGEFGPAPRFSAAAVAGTLTVNDSSCPAIHAALQAAEKGVPFMPLRGLLGSDVLAHRADWLTIDNPFANSAVECPDPVVLLPALHPDVALFHAPLADRDGNVWIGRRRELATLAHAARCVLVTVEAVTDENLFDSEQGAACALSSLYIERIAVAPRGAWPMGLAEHYPVAATELRKYARLARTAAGFEDYLASQQGRISVSA